ncbi:MnhB domain-containing protein [Pseudonocardia hispaniensis]|uniref:MnhB domain-containing protein n=1 Tax=Pseudonocardia hispaniensis TaxID=904933 RepID=A0ABW1J3C6_9PSEU
MSSPEHAGLPLGDTPDEDPALPGKPPVGTGRTLMLEMATRVLFPTVLVFSVYLLLAGHYSPGGGFSGGLVAGLAFVLRHIAGGDSEAARIGTRLRVRPRQLAGAGLTLAVLTALVPTLFGLPTLTSAKLGVQVPVLGQLDLVTSLVLDVGVYLLIVGVVLELIRSLGTGIERDAHEAEETAR